MQLVREKIFKKLAAISNAQCQGPPRSPRRNIHEKYQQAIRNRQQVHEERGPADKNRIDRAEHPPKVEIVPPDFPQEQPDPQQRQDGGPADLRIRGRPEQDSAVGGPAAEGDHVGEQEEGGVKQRGKEQVSAAAEHQLHQHLPQLPARQNRKGQREACVREQAETTIPALPE